MKSFFRYKMNIRNKVIMMLFSSSIILLGVGVSLGYLWGYNLLRDTIGANYLNKAELLNGSMNRIISEEMTDLKIYMSDPQRKSEIQKYNLKYKGMDAQSIKKYFDNMDKEWIDASPGSKLVSDYLDTPVSDRLKTIVAADLGLGEIFMTDKFGGLVASSGKTSDFYQADEKWWKDAFANGKGAAVIEHIEFDESSNALSLPTAIPIMDDSGNIIGISKAVLNINRLFAPLENFKFGKSGHAILIDEKGSILFHHELQPITTQLLGKEDFQVLLENKSKWMIIRDSSVYKKDMFFAWTLVKHPGLQKSGMDWRICISQEADEVFAPLNKLIFQLFIIIGVLTFVLITIGLIFSNAFVKPIKELRKGVEHISRGDLDYKVNINTGDEIEELANSFNQMTRDLKKSTTSINRLNKEISVRKKAEESIQEAAKQWQRTFDSISDLVFIQDTTFTILKANKAFAAAIKMKPEDIIGKKCYEVLHKRDKPWPGCPFTKTQQDSKPHTEEVDDPQIGLPLLVSTSPIFNEEGKLIGSVHLAKDISIRKRAEQVLQDTKEELEKRTWGLQKTNDTLKVLYKELEEKNKKLQEIDEIKSSFVSMVSHELRTPLSAIKEGVGIVLDGIAGPVVKDQKNFLDIARRNVDRLARLINDVLDFQKLEAGKMKFDMRKGDLNAAIKDIKATMVPAAKAKKIELLTKLGKDIPAINFDRDRITQVLTNLVDNAIKFTEKGSITICTQRKGNIIIVSVKDTGQGIEEEDTHKLFQMFEQLAKGKDRKTGGTGLGLAISKEIVGRHGGKIWVESKPGKGSTFSFALPIKDRRVPRA